MNSTESKKSLISYKRNTKIVNNKNGTYVVKVKKSNSEKIFDYLSGRKFNNYLPVIENNGSYEVYPYITEKEITKEDKAIDLAYTLSLLHTKTTTYQNIDLDKVKEIYEESINQLNYLNSYYHDLQDYIESKQYMAPGEYLLIRNVSRIYMLLEFSRQMLEKWYDEKQKLKKERNVFLHNNITLDHFLENDNAYFINWSKSHRGIVVYDFLNFYQNEHKNLEMSSLFEIYQSKYKYTKDEYFLFLSLLSIPPKVEFMRSNYINTLNVNDLINYIDGVEKFTLKENEKYQKAHQEEFNK